MKIFSWPWVASQFDYLLDAIGLIFLSRRALISSLVSQKSHAIIEISFSSTPGSSRTRHLRLGFRFLQISTRWSFWSFAAALRVRGREILNSREFIWRCGCRICYQLSGKFEYLTFRITAWCRFPLVSVFSFHAKVVTEHVGSIGYNSILPFLLEQVLENSKLALILKMFFAISPFGRIII